MYGEQDVELRNVSQDFRQLQELIDLVPDGHVIAQTLRPVPLLSNSLERSYLNTINEICKTENVLV
jgi:hypothetical protein